VVEHVVLLKPRPGVEPAAVTALWTGLGRLPGAIDGILSVEVGENSSPEGLDRGFTLGFVVRFRDSAARNGYLPHPDHLAVVPLVRAVAEEVLVFDLEVGS
jgi:hypothetical protein